MMGSTDVSCEYKGAAKDLQNEPTPDRDSQYAWLDALPTLPVDEVFELNDRYMRDSHPFKVNMTIGVYRSADGNPEPFTSVTKAENVLHEKDDLFRHEYLPAAGDAQFLTLARELIFGTDPEIEARASSVQTISGTGAVHIAAEIFSQYSKTNRVWVADPTWKNHHHIFRSTGISTSTYPYLTVDGRQLNVSGMLNTLLADARAGDVILLQACAHNPSGLDPSKAQWQQIARMCHQKHLLILFDCAYQGFASGDPVEDVWAIRHFAKSSPDSLLAVAQSFSKSFGLYGQRTGSLHIVLPKKFASRKDLLRKHLVHIIRSEFSLAPRFGSTLVKTVLQDPMLYEQWLSDLKAIHSRLRRVRTGLYEHLLQLQTPGSWDHLVKQVRLKTIVRYETDKHTDRHVLIYRTTFVANHSAT